MSSKSEYVPGMCNIGLAEIQMRKKVGWFGLAATFILLILLLLLDFPSFWRWLLFFPATISAIGFLQARQKFCVAFGWNGVFNFSSEIGKADRVLLDENKKKDRHQAIRILVYAILTGIIVAVTGLVI